MSDVVSTCPLWESAAGGLGGGGPLFEPFLVIFFSVPTDDSDSRNFLLSKTDSFSITPGIVTGLWGLDLVCTLSLSRAEASGFASSFWAPAASSLWSSFFAGGALSGRGGADLLILGPLCGLLGALRSTPVSCPWGRGALITVGTRLVFTGWGAADWSCISPGSAEAAFEEVWPSCSLLEVSLSESLGASGILEGWEGNTTVGRGDVFTWATVSSFSLTDSLPGVGVSVTLEGLAANITVGWGAFFWTPFASFSSADSPPVFGTSVVLDGLAGNITVGFAFGLGATVLSSFLSSADSLTAGSTTLEGLGLTAGLGFLAGGGGFLSWVLTWIGFSPLCSSIPSFSSGPWEEVVFFGGLAIITVGLVFFPAASASTTGIPVPSKPFSFTSSTPDEALDSLSLGFAFIAVDLSPTLLTCWSSSPISHKSLGCNSDFSLTFPLSLVCSSVLNTSLISGLSFFTFCVGKVGVLLNLVPSTLLTSSLWVFIFLSDITEPISSSSDSSVSSLTGRVLGLGGGSRPLGFRLCGALGKGSSNAGAGWAGTAGSGITPEESIGFADTMEISGLPLGLNKQKHIHSVTLQLLCDCHFGKNLWKVTWNIWQANGEEKNPNQLWNIIVSKVRFNVRREIMRYFFHKKSAIQRRGSFKKL